MIKTWNMSYKRKASLDLNAVEDLALAMGLVVIVAEMSNLPFTTVSDVITIVTS